MGLAVWIDEDPLGLRAITAALLQKHCFLIDSEELHLRCALTLAQRAKGLLSGAPSGPELVQLVEQTLLEQAQGTVHGGDSAIGHGALDPSREEAHLLGISDAFEALGRVFGLDPRNVRRAARMFNACSCQERQAFRYLILERAPMEPCAADHAGASQHMLLSAQRMAQRVLAVVLKAAAR